SARQRVQLGVECLDQRVLLSASSVLADHEVPPKVTADPRVELKPVQFVISAPALQGQRVDLIDASGVNHGTLQILSQDPATGAFTATYNNAGVGIASMAVTGTLGAF